MIYHPNIIIYLRLEGNTNDCSGYGYNFTNYGATLISPAVFGKGYDFDGANDYMIKVTNDFKLSEFTLAYWIKTADTDAVHWSYMGRTPAVGPSYGGYQSGNNIGGIPGKGYLQCLSSAGGMLTSVATTTLINDDAWHHLAFTDDGTSLKAYCDGDLEDTKASNKVWVTSMQALLGVFRIDGGFKHWTDGSMDELLLANVAFGSSDIKRLMLGLHPLA